VSCRFAAAAAVSLYSLLDEHRADSTNLFCSGLWVAIISDSLTSYIPPILQSSLLSPLLLSSFSSPSSHSQIFSLLLPTILSHSLTGFLLSPFDLLRTRLIVQSSSRKHRTYTSPYNPLTALRTIVRDEGGWLSTYFHPTLFWPTFWDITLRSLVSIATPLIIEQGLNVSLVTSPVTYRALEAVLSIGSLLITLPIETARRRLQIQSRSPIGVSPNQAGGIKTCVEVRARPYGGLVECLWRIVREESSSGGAGVWSGVKMLYRGFGLNLVASGCVFGLEAFLWAMGRESGWKEI
jgi:fusion and transport protein UGO1